MKIAVIIASRSRPQNIGLCLQSIMAQTQLARRIIVVDQSTPPYDLAAYPDVIHLHNPGLSGLTAARNVGLVAIGDVDAVFFADDDVEMDSGALAAVARAFEAFPECIGVQCLDAIAHDEGRMTGMLRKIFEQGFFRKAPWQREKYLELPVLEGFAMSFRRELFARELFDERLRGYSFGEDWEFSQRARRHGRLAVAAGGLVQHHRSPLNRHDIHAHLRDRWTHYAYFYRKLNADVQLINRLWRVWWTIGESYKWLRHGMGLPRGTALDRQPQAGEN